MTGAENRGLSDYLFFGGAELGAVWVGAVYVRVGELVDERLDLVVAGVGAVDRDLLGARRQPSELNSCSGARCRRSRSALRRSSRCCSDIRRRELFAMTASFWSGPPAAGRRRPNRTRNGCKNKDGQPARTPTAHR